jgi:hypothetical protein
VDFFVHTWNKNAFKPRNILSKKGEIIPANPEYGINHTIQDIDKCLQYKIITSEVENISIWEKRFNKKFINFSPQWYSWFKVNNLKKQHEIINNFKYDIVVKTRLDFIVPLNNSLEQEIEHVNKDLSSFYAQGVTENRINDVFFISDSLVMDKASEFILTPFSNTWYTNIFGDYLVSKDVPARNTNLDMYAIYRPESIGTSSLNFAKCFNDDHDWYSDADWTFRLEETQSHQKFRSF